jgi:hypothetical protein
MVLREIAREFILMPSEKHRDAISLVKIHIRADGLWREAFQQQLVHQHGQLVLANPATDAFLRRYAQLHNIGSTQDDPEAARSTPSPSLRSHR